MAERRLDAELELYRNLLEEPKEFKDGFGWSTVIGIFFCGLVMLPGSIYLGLMTGGSMGAASTWVTLILFNEVARRALQPLSKQHLVVLLHAAGVMLAANILFPGGPLGHLVYRAYLVTGEMVRDAGMRDSFPSWWAPAPDSPAILSRNLLHPDWLVPIALVLVLMVLGTIRRYTLGYFFFRLTSDVENLPFPLAPIVAQGAMALAETDVRSEEARAADDQAPAAEAPDEEGRMKALVRRLLAIGAGKTQRPGRGVDDNGLLRPPGEGKREFSKWRLFSLGATVGIGFGFLQVGVPAVTSLFLDKPFFLIPQPFVETTLLTESVLPATPTGMTVDLGIIGIGFVLPFWAVVGTFIAIVSTMLVNPVLHHFGVLTRWQPGMDTVNTTFANSVDFWMSLGIGAGLGIALVSIYSTVRDLRAKVREARRKRDAGGTREDLWAPPKAGRGDYPLWLALVGYAFSGAVVIYLCRLLVPQFPLAFLLLFAFVYNPLISYVNARLLGIAGQQVDIPFVKETSFILSGARGVSIWLAPIPVENYGYMAQSFRVNELTGVNFRSLMKAELVALPVLFLLSLTFWAFIWKSGPIPSDAYPAARINWELRTKQEVLLYSSTHVPPGEDPGARSIQDSEFMKAIHPKVIGGGILFTVALYAIVTWAGLPTLLIYGVIRGLGQLPHYMLLEIVGALLGRYYFQRKLGRENFLRMAPTVLAGYFTGVGLIAMATLAMRLMKEAVSSAPF